MAKKTAHVSETPATQWLRAHRVEFTEHPYDYVDHGGTAESSRQLGVDAPISPSAGLDPAKYTEFAITDEDLVRQLEAEAAKEPQPDLHIRGDKEVRYERVAQAMAAAQRAGVRKIGFVTDPAQ